MKVKNILAVKGKGVVTINPNQTIRVAILKMEKHNIGSLVVVDEAYRMVGILTERHIARQALNLDNILSQRVGEIMEPQVFSGIPQNSLNAIIKIMARKHIHHLPILDDKKLVGLVSMGDVLRAQSNEYPGKTATLETQGLADKQAQHFARGPSETEIR